MKIADSRIKPTFELEAAEHLLGSRPIAGVDEAGRGPWAGPVVAAAVILNPDKIPANIDDSKMLDEDSRAYLYRRIMKVAIVGVAIADVERIDRENILGATMWAMAEAVRQLAEVPKLVLVDGNRAPPVRVPTRTIIKGDTKCLSIAAASIVAKVTRDRLMTQMARQYPGYGFERHKGYGTPEHQAAIEKLGVSSLHRRSFRPVQLALALADA
ncbi:ribonuclease HII [Hyphomicrobium sp.]|uniref:ribonuclease HII n=1 Tax=Hyphomicrobium sp. TaxID=82 RepID=UPI002D77B3BD|nr:ribonuclease HII [Hyphomicrobium sp.]HET6389711.1 ribonuclease HII [Hyphomicrobium sp.]